MSGTWAVRPAAPADFATWGPMRAALWPDEAGVSDASQMQDWLDDACKGALLALGAGGEVIGFIELALRHDYVNGTASSPVGFVEGWYVASPWRSRGAGRALVSAAEAWACDRGCSELASDALLDNAASHAAHAACGFEETERVVYFRKSLAP